MNVRIHTFVYHLLHLTTIFSLSYDTQNKAIESKEGHIMELQYKIDDLSAKTDGWKASLEGIVTDDALTNGFNLVCET